MNKKIMAVFCLTLLIVPAVVVIATNVNPSYIPDEIIISNRSTKTDYIIVGEEADDIEMIYVFEDKKPVLVIEKDAIGNDYDKLLELSGRSNTKEEDSSQEEHETGIMTFLKSDDVMYISEIDIIRTTKDALRKNSFDQNILDKISKAVGSEKGITGEELFDLAVAAQIFDINIITGDFVYDWERFTSKDISLEDFASKWDEDAASRLGFDHDHDADTSMFEQGNPGKSRSDNIPEGFTVDSRITSDYIGSHRDNCDSAVRNNDARALGDALGIPAGVSSGYDSATDLLGDGIALQEMGGNIENKDDWKTIEDLKNGKKNVYEAVDGFNNDGDGSPGYVPLGGSDIEIENPDTGDKLKGTVVIEHDPIKNKVKVTICVGSSCTTFEHDLNAPTNTDSNNEEEGEKKKEEEKEDEDEDEDEEDEEDEEDSEDEDDDDSDDDDDDSDDDDSDDDDSDDEGDDDSSDDGDGDDSDADGDGDDADDDDDGCENPEGSPNGKPEEGPLTDLIQRLEQEFPDHPTNSLINPDPDGETSTVSRPYPVEQPLDGKDVIGIRTNPYINPIDGSSGNNDLVLPYNDDISDIPNANHDIVDPPETNDDTRGSRN